MSTAASIDSRKVLLVENHPDDLRWVREVLSETSSDGFDLITVRSHSEAVARMAEETVDVILLALSLPNAEGLEILTRMRASVPHLPIVVVTEGTDETSGLQAVRAGAHDYLLKDNLDNRLLKRVLGNAIERRRADQAQRESEKRYRSLFENMLNGFAYCKMEFDQERPQDFLYLEVNAAFETLTGLKNVVGKKVSEVVPGIQESDPELFASYGRVALSGQSETLEIYVASLAMWFSIAIYSPQKHYFVSVFEVITERKRVEEALRTSEIRFRALIEKSSEAVLLVGANGVVIYDSPSAARITGYAATEHTNRRMFDQVHPDDRVIATQFFTRLLQQPSETVITQLRIGHKDGSWRWIEGVATNLLAEPSVGAIVINYRDVTDRKRSEEELARYRDHLEQLVAQRTAELEAAKGRAEAILDNSADGILLVNPNLQIQQTNIAFKRLFACVSDDYFNQPLITLAQAEDAPLMTRIIQASTVAGQARTIELHALRNDGTVFDAEFSIGHIKGDGLVCTVRDITERKRAEVELRRAWAQEKQLNELKTGFVSMVSHDFRTPLASIQSSSDLLRNYSQRMTDEKKQHHFTTINGQIKHLTGLLEDMLTITKAESVGLPFHPTLTDLGLFCQTIADEMQALAGTRQIRFTINRPGEQVSIDPDLLRRALINLLSNAVKYSPEGGVVEFSVSIEDEQIEIRVNDQGIGIPDDDLSHLFEVFHRATNVGTIPGTGLGLAIVKRAVEAHGGTIGVQSAVGVGSAFTVRLPAALGIEEDSP